MNSEELAKYDDLVPTYHLVDGEEPLVKRKIAKVRETAETFTFYDILSYKARLEKGIEDKEKELEGLKKLLENYNKELEVIKEALGVDDIDADYQKTKAIEEALKSAVEQHKENVKNKEPN